jgi:hypothetical protein
LNSAGYIILFWQIQQDVKREMIQKISGIVPDNELTCIKFPKSGISSAEWKDMNELEYQGSMYDVVKKEESPNYYILYCLNDQKEDALIKIYNRHFSEDKEKSAQNNLRVPITLIAPAILKYNISIKRINTISSINNYLSFNYNSIWLDKLTPPPKQIA